MAEHIRIGDVAPRVQYVGDGAQTAFTYPFPIFAAADMEVRLDGLVQSGGFAIAGAGSSEGGSVSFVLPPAAGAVVTLRRRLKLERNSDFQDNGVLRARALNDELDRQVAALQELREEISGTLRQDGGEVGGQLTLPARGVRANRVLGFDSVGGVTVFSREEGVLAVPFVGAVPRTVEDKLAERLSARDFGATGDGATDDGPALQAAMNAAAASGKELVLSEGSFRTTQPLTLPGAAAGLLMRGTILYAGPAGQPALTLGDGGAMRNASKSYTGIRVLRATISDWSDEGDIGVLLRNLDASQVEIRQVEGFCIGIRTLGDERGFEDSTLQLGRIVNNRIGLDVRTGTASGWNNAVRYIGGHFACASGVNPTLARFGVRFSRAEGAYSLHNHHVFIGPGFELQRQGTPGTVDAIPFLLEVDGRALLAEGIRMEACSPYVARHTGAFSDALYQVAYVGTYGFTGCAVHYPAGATRAGGTVVPLHQAAASVHAPRLVAAAENVRSRAFRQTIDVADGVGFDQMAVLSGNPSGAPLTLDGFCFAGLNQIGLNANDVTLPTSRALAFVVDSSTCKEFLVAAEGAGLRVVVMQFDAAGNLLGRDHPALLSNMNILDRFPDSAEPSTACWWEGNGDLDLLSGGVALNRLQRVTLHPDAAFAAIGVRGGSSGAVLRALRLYAPGTEAPALIYGGTRRWGVREYAASVAWDPPELVPGASADQTVAVPQARPGDFVQGAFSVATTLPLEVLLSASEQVRARFTNSSGGNVNLASGTLHVRVVKPRV
jgi:hypothetical protein